MEDDVGDTFEETHDYSAVVATEQSYYEALVEDSSTLESNLPTCAPFESHPHSSCPVVDNDGEDDWFSEVMNFVPENYNLDDGSKLRKTRQIDETECQENERRNKLSASHDDGMVQMDEYDDVMLWTEDKVGFEKTKKHCSGRSKSSKGSRRSGKEDNKEDIVDLNSLLIMCAQAVSNFDTKSANELLKQIRQHSSQHGNSNERVAHYFALGLQARIEGTGSYLSADPVIDNCTSSSEILRSYRTYIRAIPCKRASYYLANQTMVKMCEDAERVHIVDFGIYLGFQWPSFVHSLSNRANGPPKLRITGIAYPQRGFKPSAMVEEAGKRIEDYCRRFNVPFEYNAVVKMCEDAERVHIVDFGIYLGFQWPSFVHSLSNRANGPPKLRITGIAYPQRGFKPSAMVEEAGKRIEDYCRRFHVPFEYNAVVKKWDDITTEDIRVERGELLMVNCVYESRLLVEDTSEEEDSPKDTFLRLIMNLNPDIFVHGTINGSFSSPFFMARFKKALNHYSSIFNMNEATVPFEERLLIEKEVSGKSAMNVIACEGAERSERPETYKQWHIRKLRAGFTQIPYDRELLVGMKEMIRANYHRDFFIGDDRNWMIQGWKGRILYAMSCWKCA